MMTIHKHGGPCIAIYTFWYFFQLRITGGDIDLLLLFDDMQDKDRFFKIKHVILSEIKKNIGDQKIDLLFSTKEELTTNEFLKIIFPTAVCISS